MNIFQYESKFNQMLVSVADMILLNLAFVICCLPIVTIGASCAGLFTGIRVFLDKEDDSSPLKAFFKGFISGIGTVTIVGVILMALILGNLYLLLNLLALYWAGGSIIPLILCVISLSIFLMLFAVLGPFHATFGCTVGQLFRNVFYVAIGNAPRVLVVTALMLLPFILFFTNFSIFMGSMVVMLAIYFSISYFLSFHLLKKPFDQVKELFYAAQEAAKEETEGEDEEAEEEDEDESDEETEDA